MNGLKSIKLKFTLWYLAVLGMVLIVLNTGIYWTMSHKLDHSLDQALKLRAEQIVKFREVIAIVAGGAFEEEPGELISFYFYMGNRLMNISHKQKEIPIQKEWIDTVLSGEQRYNTIKLNRHESLRVYAIPYSPSKTMIRTDRFRVRRKYDPGQEKDKIEKSLLPPQVEIKHSVLMVARSTKEVNMVLKRLIQIMLFALPLTLFFSGWGGIFLLKRILNPIDQISQTARKIEATDLSKRIKVTSNDELGNLGNTLNMMIDRLEKAFKRQKEFTSDASHELRAPLAVIQAEASLSLQKQRDAAAYRKSLETIAREAEYMSEIIKQILFLARIDSGHQTIVYNIIALNTLLSNICDEIEVLCQEKEQHFSYHIIDDVTIKGDESLLKNLFLNLLTNATRYTPRGGEVKLDLSVEDEMAVIKIKDTGMGIPAEELPHIFKRFYRVDKARSRESGGSGLGLSIASQIVETHNGKLQVESKINEGSTFIVRIPVLNETA